MLRTTEPKPMKRRNSHGPKIWQYLLLGVVAAAAVSLVFLAL
ncbi:hypothetical protein [Paramicrobacterium humi]|nr:hypothetical protein [Microbacterium humi]